MTEHNQPTRPLTTAIVVAVAVAIASLPDIDPAPRMGLALLWLIAAFWMLELLHVTLTALLVPVLATVMGLSSLPQALSHFAHPIIFLFLGGFALAAALQAQGIDRALAERLLTLSGGHLGHAILLLSAAAALLSMWISNTAAAAIMIPLVSGMLRAVTGIEARTRWFALLAMAYSASLGGIATLVGSPPNAIVAAHLGLSFRDWLLFGIPVLLVLWPAMLLLLAGVLRPQWHLRVPIATTEAFAWTPPRVRLALIFGMTTLGWLSSSGLGPLLGVERDMDSWIALAALIALGATRVTTWSQIAATTDWGVLMLFGGGLCLSAILQATGTSAVLGEWLAATIGTWPPLLILGAITLFVIFLTELSSNTATAALLVPLFTALPLPGLSEAEIAIAVGLAASCAFMLPVATPPNAIVHGTGLIPQRAMMKAGLRLNLLATLLLTLMLTVLARLGII